LERVAAKYHHKMEAVCNSYSHKKMDLTVEGFGGRSKLSVGGGTRLKGGRMS
jgi:hypothetical protein